MGKLSLLLSVVLSLFISAISFITGNLPGAIVGLVFSAFSICYAWCVWSRIPIATANLVTGLTAVRANLGITLIGYVFSIVAFGWTALWSLAALGVYDISPDVEGCVKTDENTFCQKEINYGYFFLLFLSLYWSQQVFSNVVHTSVAGTIGTWWFVPEEASSCCSSAVTSSVCRASTYSFGSICFGSLLVAIIKALRATANQARNGEDANAILVCVVDCLLACIQGMVEYFNKWAFIYVGIYGYGYLEAGKNVMTLFGDRGWEMIITDNLVDNTLGMVTFLFAGVIGAFGLVLVSVTPWFDVMNEASDSDIDIAKIVAFSMAFIVGLFVSSIILSVVNSACDTAIVLFAEAPAEFESNHPLLSNNMRAAYMAIYPDCM